MSSYIYSFVRRDLSHAQMIVQHGHACYEAGKQFNDNVGISNLILLDCVDEEELLNIARKMDAKGIEYYMFYEPDISAYTSICTAPVISEQLRSFFGKWDLYKQYS